MTMKKENKNDELEYVFEYIEVSPEIALRFKQHHESKLERIKVRLTRYILEETSRYILKERYKRINSLIMKENVTLQDLGFSKKEQHGIVVFYIKGFEHPNEGYRIYMSKIFNFYTVYNDDEKLFDNEDIHIPIELLELRYAILNECKNMRQDYLSKKDNGRK